MKRILVVGLIAASLFVLGSVSWAAESDVDRLLELLVKKGVVTTQEAVEFRADLAVKKQEEKQPVGLPDWVQNTKLKGDFRLRYEWDKNKGQQDQSRARIRARLGLESKINNKLTMGVGIATGTTGDPRSRNITLGNSSTKNTPGSGKDIVLDYAYGKYMPFKWLTLTGGKFQNPLWQPHDAFWKSDITPEGEAINISKTLNPKLDLFLNQMFFALRNDSRTDKQPFLNALQPGLNYAFNDKISLKSAFTYYLFSGVRNAAQFSYSKGGNSALNTVYSKSSGNTLNASGKYKYNYNAIQPTVELSFKEPFSRLLPALPLPYASVFSDFMYNPEPTTGNGGYDVGVKFGVEKVSDWGQWQGKFIYSKLGRDCWMDILTDNDRYGGVTNSKTYEAIYEYGLGKSTSLVLDYYHSQGLDRDKKLGYAPEQVLQIDWNMKF
jgi:hypothetical protein